MNLGLLLSPGDSLFKQQKSGQLDRFLRYYLQPYSKNFDQVYLFSYGDSSSSIPLPSRITLIPKPKLIPYQLYQLFIPLIHRRLIQSLDLFRVFQAIGGLPLLFINKPFLVTYGYHYDQFARIEKHPFKARLIDLIIRPVLNQADQIIVTSKANQRYLTRLGYQSKLQLIPNGVDPSTFKPKKSPRDKFLVLSIGRLTYQKNHQFLLKSINQSQFKSQIKLVIIGRGILKSGLISQAKKFNFNLKIIPSLSHQQLVSWYQKAAVFTLTSKIEGQPKVLLEAMSSSCPCLATPFPGNIIKNNQTGLIAETPDQLAQKLDQLLTHPPLRQKLGHQARQTIIKNFNIKELVKKEIALLKSLAS